MHVYFGDAGTTAASTRTLAMPLSAYVKKRWRELLKHGISKSGTGTGVSRDNNGAFAASRLIFVEVKRNPELITNSVPPNADVIMNMINNPSGFMDWIDEKVSRSDAEAKRNRAIALDNPVTRAMDNWNPLTKKGRETIAESGAPWYLQPTNLAIAFGAFLVVPVLLKAGLVGYFEGKGRGRI